MTFFQKYLSGRYAARLVVAVLYAAWLFPAAAREEPGPGSNPLGSNLPGLLAYAREHNPEFVAMRYEAEAAAQRAQSAASLPDPVLRTELMDITRQGTSNPSLLPSKVGGTQYTLMQSLPWFGKRDLQRGGAEAQVAQANAQTSATWAELSSKIKSVYAMYYYLSNNQRLAHETLNLMAGLEQVAQTRYSNGLGAQQDVIRAQVEQTSLRSELLEFEKEQHHAQARLNALMSRPAMVALAKPVQLRPIPAATLTAYPLIEEKLRARNPQLMMADARRDEAEKNRDMIFKNRYPDITVGVAPTQTGSRISEWELMIEINIPLQQSARRSQERGAEAMLAASTARKEAVLNQMLADLSESVISLETAQRTESLITTRLLPQAELTYQSALAVYETGKVDFSTLLDAQRQILKANQQQFKAQLEAQLSLAEIERLLGEEL